MLFTLFVLTAQAQALPFFTAPLPRVELKIDANVFREDDRREILSQKAPWSAVGKLFGPAGNCTASLVGPALLLTAAHCVTKEGRIVMGDYRFYPGYKKGKSTVYAGVEVFHVGTMDAKAFPDDDWAILELREDLGNTYGWFGARDQDLLEDTGPLYMAGYPSDLGGSAGYWQKGCRFTAVSPELRHDCDMTPGASGAPMFIFDDPSDRLSNFIVAINVAEYRNGADHSLLNVPYTHQTANVAVPAAKFLPKLKELKAR